MSVCLCVSVCGVGGCVGVVCVGGWVCVHARVCACCVSGLRQGCTEQDHGRSEVGPDQGGVSSALQ